jgi:PAS domain S-box-containing protein
MGNHVSVLAGSALPAAQAPSAPDKAPGEDALDRLTRLASELLQAPVALIVLLAEGQPRLVRSFGLPDRSRGELPATHPFWARVLASEGTVAVADGPRVAWDGTDPAGSQPGMAAWLSVPLASPGRDVLGCLCVASPQPREWSETEMARLRDLAAVVGAVMGPSGLAQEGKRGSEEAAILNSVPHACFALDRQGRFTYLNARAEQLFRRLSRHPVEGLLGKNIWDKCPEVGDSNFARECQQALAEQRPLSAEAFYPELHRWFAVHVSPVSGDRLCVFLQDVSERVELERGLRKRAEALAEADRGKGVFLVQLAHEVRNALAPVRGALHLAQRRGPEDEGPDGQRACALADQEVQRLSRLMDDLLKASHALEGNVRLHKEEVNLAVIVAHSLTAAISSPAAGGRNISLHLPPEPVQLEAAPEELEQVVTHLLDNAIKFTSPGGHVRLSVERAPGKVTLRVQDDGAGISAEALPHVFNMFMREHGDSRGPRGGLGIGLTLVRQLVELHGGTVEARSEGPGRGSEFIVHLPTSEAQVAAPTSSVRVLVAEDSMDIAQGLLFLLRSWGYEGWAAYDGPQALEAVRAHRPDVVLLDIDMPGMSGYEVAERLWQREGSEKPVLVAVTGYGEQDDRERGRQAGLDYYMVKPIDPTELRELLTAVEITKRQRSAGPEG